jgi:hypothetical protein
LEEESQNELARIAEEQRLAEEQANEEEAEQAR